jgi:hypothetical protein
MQSILESKEKAMYEAYSIHTVLSRYSTLEKSWQLNPLSEKHTPHVLPTGEKALPLIWSRKYEIYVKKIISLV